MRVSAAGNMPLQGLVKPPAKPVVMISSATFLSQVVSNEVRECTWLGYRPPRPVGETGGRYHLGESEAQRLFFRLPQPMCSIVLMPGKVGHC